VGAIRVGPATAEDQRVVVGRIGPHHADQVSHVNVTHGAVRGVGHDAPERFDLAAEELL
jgi:hypothetical protein